MSEKRQAPVRSAVSASRRNRHILIAIPVVGLWLYSGRWSPLGIYPRPEPIDQRLYEAFVSPASEAVDLVNPFIGSAGPEPNLSGGMIPSVAPPFGMTRWVAQTTDHSVSMTPYNYSKSSIHGFVGTHQPAIWMGESGHATIVPGIGDVKPRFEDRGMEFSHDRERATPSYYEVELASREGAKIQVQQSATSRVGQLRFTFDAAFVSEPEPWLLLQASRPYEFHGWTPGNLSYPTGAVTIDDDRREIYGFNRERQDNILGPDRAPKFSGYFVARFDVPWTSAGLARNCNTSQLFEGETSRTDEPCLSGYVRFSKTTKVVNVRIGVSFISIDQARANLDDEIPDGRTLEETAHRARKAWAENLDRIKVQGGTKEQRITLYTAAFHALQYPYEIDEGGRYYSPRTDSVHEGISYNGFSIWDTYRAAWAWQILMVPERIDGIVTSMLQMYKEGGFLPMWENLGETNIMIGTHADSLVAEALLKGFRGFDVNLAYEAIRKDATIPPENDKTTVYADREEGVGYEVRAGLSSRYEQDGWVANDVHSEAASRTLDYAYDDYAVSVAASVLGHQADAEFFAARAYRAVHSIFDNSTGFMCARNANGSWAKDTEGWTEGDKWAYSFDVVQNVEQLVELKGGNASLIAFLDEHFYGGHNDHTNEPSHHIPYLYSLVGAASDAQIRVRAIAASDYNATEIGLSGNEDCGQMSAWFLFSSLGFYPVDPVSGTYVIGAPLFDRMELHLPRAKRPFIMEADGAGSGLKKFIKAVTLNGKALSGPIIRHEDVANGGRLVFTMSETPQAWASEEVRNA